MRRFEASPRRATPKGQTFINCTAPPSPSPSYRAQAPAFVAHTTGPSHRGATGPCRRSSPPRRPSRRPVRGRRVGRAHYCARPPSEPDWHAFRASGSSKPQRLAGRAEVLGRCHGVLSAAAFCVYETEATGLVRPVALPEEQALLAQRLAGNANPKLPLNRGLRRVIGVQEQVPAAWTAPGLHLQQTQAELVQGRGNSFAPSVSPVLGEAGIVRRRPALDHPMSDDAGPGELGAVRAAVAVAEHPPVPPGPVELPEVPVHNPVPVSYTHLTLPT